MVGQGETPATFSPPNNPASGTMLWFELPVLLRALGASPPSSGGPMLVNAVAGEGVGERWDGVTWPAPRQLTSFETFPVMPETHAVYAATWGSLSLFGLVAATHLLARKGPPRGGGAMGAAVRSAAKKGVEGG